MSANSAPRMRLFGLVLFAAGCVAVWIVVGGVCHAWLTGAPTKPSFSVVWIVSLIGGLSAVSGAIVFVRLSLASGVPPPSAPWRSAPDRELRRWCVAMHASALIGYVLPFAHLVLPVSIWLSKRHLHPFVDASGRAAFNFQISITLFALVGVLMSVLVIGVLVIFAVVLLHVAMTVAAVRSAARGELPAYRLSMSVF